MKSLKRTVPAALAVILLPLSAQTYAQEATLTDCQAIQDRLARYACYDNWDAASGAVRPSSPARARAPAQQQEDETSLFGRIFDGDSEEEPAPASAATPASTVDTFGRSDTARVRQNEDGRSELVDTIAALEQVGPSLWLITLEGGQQWKQMISKRYNLLVGDEIRIYPTRWGSSYRLASERAGGYIQVERVDTLAGAAPVPAPAREPAPAQAAAEPPEQEEKAEGSLLGRLFNRNSDEPAGAEPAAADAEPQQTAESFGRQQNARVVQGENGSSELIDVVADLEQLGPSLWLITLEGGQQWQQMLSKRYALQVGDEVRIYPTRWGGSFRLSSERVGGYIQVERVD